MIGKTMIWGLGNELYGDDQVGIEVCRKLMEMDADGRLEISICYTVPGNYVSKAIRLRPSRLILVDASDMGLKPGEFRRFSLDEIEDVSFTNHDMPIDKMLAPLSPITTVIGIQPQRVELGAPLTDLMEKTATTVAGMIARGEVDHIPRL